MSTQLRGWVKREIGRLNEFANKCHGARPGSTGYLSSAYAAFARNMEEGKYDDQLAVLATLDDVQVTDMYDGITHACGYGLPPGAPCGTHHLCGGCACVCHDDT